ncbi:SMI1/KNR4 family protein [Actinoallomurus iriomotensis]|uniref:SMI1/KNR4 family protein n=1 Tax=Actinoallomurus iriomotensis TaxID=478107 RepID=A0A9W6SB22_9ACTN|nr:SMI1/KNR4 family protein [Actinoallomurus iriomotensis]GLY88977.1 hypothetical protein Airi02_069060 [Actinoallomurus iriomotensis]
MTSPSNETSKELILPVALTELAQVLYTQEPPYDDEDNPDEQGPYIDFEPYERFMTPDEFAFGSWTGNDEVDGSEFRVFGSTGAGDKLGFWLVRPGVPVDEQPVVHFGSEGGASVMACDLGDLLWYFANGFLYDAQPNEALRLIAEHHAPERRRSNEEIEAAAEAEFPGFSAYITSLCR